MSDHPAIIVIGASAGGVDAIRTLTSALPAHLDAALFIVLHIGAHRSELPALLNEWGELPARHPPDGEKISPGRIYVAPPDHHMLLERGAIRLTRGPRENWARPAIDPLFRSAARAYGSDVTGIILTGGLNDGTAGLFEVTRHGGTAIVQDPDDATDPGMPDSALRHVAVDHCVPVAAMPRLLERLVAARSRPPDAKTDGTAPKLGSKMMAEYTLDHPVAVTCPDCGGALRKTELGTLTQFRCHIGHVYTAEIMVAAQFAAMEWSLEAALRSLNERGELCRQMADQCRRAEDLPAAALWGEATREAGDASVAVRDLLERDWIHPGRTAPVKLSGG